MPTPHGSRGGMAFSADELRVLRRALAQVLNPPNQALTPPHTLSPARLPNRARRQEDDWARRSWIDDVQDVLRLAEAVEEAVDEAGRMRLFALAELSRYRAALPGSAAGYLERLEEAVADGYLPDAEDLTALRTLTALHCAPPERIRRLHLRSRCGELAEAAVRRRLEAVAPRERHALPAPLRPAPAPPAAVPAPGPATAPYRSSDSRAAGWTAGWADNRSSDRGDARTGSRADNVAEFARPSRPPRPRVQPLIAAPAAGGHSHPLPTRRGGPIPMASSDPAARPTPAPPAPPERPADPERAPEEDPAAEEPVKPAAPARPVPTPGDVWPRGVRKDPQDGTELATGTG